MVLCGLFTPMYSFGDHHVAKLKHYGLLCTWIHMHICTCTSACGHPQTMNGLKTLLTQERINFTDATFNTEDGIGGLGEQPFVSNMSTC